jgi:heme exporter protein B
VIAILGKDLLLERRTKANLNALIFLGGVILVIISFALGPSPARLHSAAAGVLWVAFVFAGVLAFARAYQAETDNRCFEGLLLAGAEPRAIYVGKLLGTCAIMLVVETAVTAALGVLYGLNLWRHIPELALAMALGTLGVAAVGVLYGRLTMSLRAREILLPLLVLPAVVPVLLAAVEASSVALRGSTSTFWTWLELLIVFDVVFVTAAILVYPTLCEE